MAEVPDDAVREGLDVGERAAAVGDVRQHGQRALGHVARLRAEQRVDLEDRQLEAASAGDALQHVAVRREVVLVGRERGDRGIAVQDRADELEQVHGDAVGDEDRAGGGAEHLGERVAGAGGRVDPVVPAADELAAPLVDHAVQALARALGQPAERVAVQVRAGARPRSRTGRGTAASGSLASSRSASSRVTAMPAPPSRAGCPGRCGRSGPRRAPRSATRRSPRRSAARSPPGRCRRGRRA